MIIDSDWLQRPEQRDFKLVMLSLPFEEAVALTHRYLFETREIDKEIALMANKEK